MRVFGYKMQEKCKPRFKETKRFKYDIIYFKRHLNLANILILQITETYYSM
jgi:hypothetical protein